MLYSLYIIFEELKYTKICLLIFFHIAYFYNKVLYDPAEHLYYNQRRILGLIEIPGKSKTDKNLIDLIF